jgi:pimeloyl-ACP methyl ester carboxylesterase
MLPGALRFTEEGDVLGLVAPRALMVVNATRDAFQFSVGEARKSLARVQGIYKLFDAAAKVRHAVFESGHAYSQPMRETVYGWMTRWLKGEGEGKPVPEPKHTVETAEDLACYPPGSRPKTFLLLPAFAARAAAPLLKKLDALKPKHAEDWESTAVHMRTELRKTVFGDFPEPSGLDPKLGKPQLAGDIATGSLLLTPEPNLPMQVTLKFPRRVLGRLPACVLLHLGGAAEALKHPLVPALLDRRWEVVVPELRATGAAQPKGDAIAGAPDHTSAEHALWVGRPVLGQWVFDVHCLLDWMARQRGLNSRRFAVVGIGQAGVVALCAGGMLHDRVASVAALDAPVSYVTDQAYPKGTRMGLLAPGILRVADVPHLAALAAPRNLQIIGGVTPQGKALDEKGLKKAFAFTSAVYAVHKARLKVAEKARPADVAASL